MTLKIQDALELTGMISRQIRDCYRPLTVHFIVHHEGDHAQAMAMAAEQIIAHPAKDTALHLLTRARNTGDSGVIGMAVAKQNLFFGLASHDSILALCTLNVDRYATREEAMRHAYHMAWHAIDAMHYNNELNEKSGPPREITIRRRNVLEFAAANLRADVFAAVTSFLQGDQNALRDTGISRGLNVLHAVPSRNPEHFPFIIAMESTQAALDRLKEKPLSRRKQVPEALRIAREVGRTYDKNSLRQWLAFAEPAQEMAWRDAAEDSILSAAINTSRDTHVRAIGYLTSEITGIKPGSVLETRENYSPFADDEFNRTLHERSIDDIFEDVIAQGLKANKSDPFLQAAHQQNMTLTQGHAEGWCASALQAAARAFDSAIRSGAAEPASAARKEFEGERARTTWDSLRNLGRKVIGQYRTQGIPPTLDDVARMARDDGNASVAILKSVEATIKDHGGSYSSAARAAPRLAGPAPRGPAPAPAMPAPVLGFKQTGAAVAAANNARAATTAKDKKGEGKSGKK